MADGYGVFIKNRGGKQTRDEDFQEDEVWAVIKDREDSISSPKLWAAKQSLSGSSSSWRLPTAPKVISRSSNESQKVKMVQQQSSAPINIPDWSKIYKKKGSRNGDDDLSDDDDDDETVPPHEYIARKLARTQISSFSMCEGIGRTLKGRDLSKVRNAILSKTGFLEE